MSVNRKIYIDFLPEGNAPVFHYQGQAGVPVKDATGRNSKKFWIEDGGSALIHTDTLCIFIDANGGVKVSERAL